MAIPGPFDYERGIGLFADVGKFESLYGVDVRDALLAGLPGPPGSIVFLNDADAFLWGEWLFGAAAGHERCVGITLGTGIGSAFIADGELRHDGPGVPPEGRVDLLQIGGLPLEEVVSARAIERLYQERTGVVPDGTAFVARQARNGDKTAASVLQYILRATRPGPAPVAGGVRRQHSRHRGFHDRVVGPDRAGPVARPRGAQSTQGGQMLQSEGATSLKGLTGLSGRSPRARRLLGAAAYAERTVRRCGRPPAWRPTNTCRPARLSGGRYASNDGRPASRSARAVPTMRDVATLAGVSVMTVSRVLHDDPRITEDTKSRVRAAVQELGYLRNDTARNLRIGRGADAIGLVIGNLANPFYSQLALGVGEVAEEHGLTVMFVNAGRDVEREERLVVDFMSRRVEGIIIAPEGDDHRHLATGPMRGAPVVFVARPPSGIAADCVLVDDFAGTKEANGTVDRARAYPDRLRGPTFDSVDRSRTVPRVPGRHDGGRPSFLQAVRPLPGERRIRGREDRAFPFGHAHPTYGAIRGK